MSLPNENIAPQFERAFIGLGSNLEPRLDYLRSAMSGLRAFGKVGPVSSIYETAPVGDVAQPDYLNAVVEIHTALGPFELVARLKDLERAIGRKERPRWHEREIDLDLVFYGDLTLNSPELSIPHSELHWRAFVLIPMAELDPYFLHPVLKKSVTELLRTTDASRVKLSPLKL